MHVRRSATRSAAAAAALALSVWGVVAVPGVAHATGCTRVELSSLHPDLTAQIGSLTPATTYCLHVVPGILVDAQEMLDEVGTATDTGRAPGQQDVIAGWQSPDVLVWTVPPARHGVAAPRLDLLSLTGTPMQVDYTWTLTAPQAPTGLVAEATGPTTMHVSWADAVPGSFSVSGYDVAYRAQGAESFTPYDSTDGLEMDLTGLDPSTTYEVQVRARDIDDRLSPYSEPASATTEDAVAPGTPTDLAGEATGTSSLAVTWTASDPGTFAAHHYVVRYRELGTQGWQSLAPVRVTEAAVVHLQDATDYELDVAACDLHDVCSAPTDPITVATDAIVLPAPLHPLVSSPDAIVTGAAATFELSAVSDSAVVEAGDLAPGVTAVEVDGLVVTVRTRRGFTGDVAQPLHVVDGQQTADVDATVTVVPEAVSRLTYRIATAATSSVRWTAAAGATRYVVAVDGRTVCTTSASSCTVGGLLGPASRVTVVGTGGDATESAAARGTWTASAVTLGHVHFVGDTATLNASSQARLRLIAERLHAVGISQLTVHGYTATQDRTTRSAAQLRLSGQRAAAAAAVVSAWYAAHHASVRIVRVADGATHPVASNASYAGRAENRRAEIAIG